MVALLGLRQASAPAARASPGCDASVVPAFRAAPGTGNTALSFAPPPPRGQGWRKGGIKQEGRHELASHTFFLQNIHLLQKNPGVRTFGRNFFGIFNFQPEKIRPENFRTKFFRQKKFRGQKKYGFPDSMACIPENGLRRRVELVVEPTPLFPTFAPTFFSFFNFRPENFPVFQISSRKNLARKLSNRKFLPRKNFRPYERDVIGRIHFEWPAPPSS